MAAESLFIAAQRIIREALRNKPRLCLDLETGRVVKRPRSRALVGEGRPAVQKGMRYIAIPCLLEEATEVASHFVPRLDRKPLRDKRHLVPQLLLAGSIVSRNWVRTLELRIPVEWLDIDFETVLLLDPSSRVWKRMPRRSASASTD